MPDWTATRPCREAAASSGRSAGAAYTRRWTGQDGQPQDETEWFTVVAWDQLAETCHRIVTKGRKVYVEGRLRTRSWEGQDGQKKHRTEPVAQQMTLLDGRPRTEDAGASPAGGGTAPPSGDEGTDDDVPF